MKANLGIADSSGLLWAHGRFIEVHLDWLELLDDVNSMPVDQLGQVAQEIHIVGLNGLVIGCAGLLAIENEIVACSVPDIKRLVSQGFGIPFRDGQDVEADDAKYYRDDRSHGFSTQNVSIQSLRGIRNNPATTTLQLVLFALVVFLKLS